MVRFRLNRSRGKKFPPTDAGGGALEQVKDRAKRCAPWMSWSSWILSSSEQPRHSRDEAHRSQPRGHSALFPHADTRSGGLFSPDGLEEKPEKSRSRTSPILPIWTPAAEGGPP
jgi:hypothetical protein